MLETETVLDRRRLRRSVTLWRAAGLAAIAIAIGVMTLGTDKLATLAGEKQIARITLEGTITEDRDQLKMLKDIADDNSVSGVLLYVNSPGGTTTGGEALYEGLRDARPEEAGRIPIRHRRGVGGLYRRPCNRPHRCPR